MIQLRSIKFRILVKFYYASLALITIKYQVAMRKKYKNFLIILHQLWMD